MGYGLIVFEFFKETCEKLGFNNLKNKWMLELGNQKIRPKVMKKYDIKFEIAKDYFESLDCIHYSFDINGENGAIPLDLSKPCNIDFFEKKFNIVTNAGTIEHIDNKKRHGQWQAWKNIHDLAKPGALFIHALPEKGFFPIHCLNHYDMNFIHKLCKVNQYKLILLKSKGKEIKKQKRFILASYIKVKDIPFTDNKKEFKSWIDIKTPKQLEEIKKLLKKKND